MKLHLILAKRVLARLNAFISRFSFLGYNYCPLSLKREISAKFQAKWGILNVYAKRYRAFNVRYFFVD